MRAIAYKGGGKSLILAIFVRTYYVDHPLWERQFFSIETFKQMFDGPLLIYLIL